MKSRIVYTPSGGAKKSRGIRKIVFLVATSMGCLLIAGGAIFILRAETLQIRGITINGADTLDERIVRERVGATLTGAHGFIFPRSSFFLANTRTIASAITEEFPRIQDIMVAKKFPDQIAIIITERAWWGVFCNGLAGSSTPICAYLDPQGISYEHAPEPQGKLIMVIRSDQTEDITLGKPAIDPALMKQIRNLAQITPAETGITLSDFTLYTRVPGEIRAGADEGFALLFNREDNYTETLGTLKRILDDEIKERRSQLDYIDLRFGNKVFYRLK